MIVYSNSPNPIDKHCLSLARSLFTQGDVLPKVEDFGGHNIFNQLTMICRLIVGIFTPGNDQS